MSSLKNPSHWCMRNARLYDGLLVDLLIHEGVIADLVPSTNSTLPPFGMNVVMPPGHIVDVRGGLVLPGFIEGHVHLDKTLWGTWHSHDSGPTVRDRIQAEKRLRIEGRPTIEQCASELLEALLQSGTTSLRTHVDIDEVTRLDNLEAVLELRETWADRLTIQIVAFPQSGLLDNSKLPGLLEEAVRLGADLVGGLDPQGIDGDASKPLDIVFGLAQKYNRGVDIHLHDRGEVGLKQIHDIARRTREGGLSGRATISHAFALFDASPQELARTAELLSETGVSICSNVPGLDFCPPLLKLSAMGVDVFLGTDNIRDSWSPMSIVSMVDRMLLAAYRFGLRTDEELTALLEHVVAVPHRVTGMGSAAVAIGQPADLIVFCQSLLPQVIMERAMPDQVFRKGVRVFNRQSNS